MLQAAKKNKLKTVALVVCLLCVLSVSVAVAAAFLNTNRDTRPAPDKVTSKLEKTNAYQLLCKRGDYKYYFRDDRDIILVENTKTGYIWKTGVDVPLNSEIEEAFDVVNSAKEDNDPSEIKDYAESKDMTVKQVKELANTPKDSSFTNDQYGAYANSLLTVEYYTGSGKAYGGQDFTWEPYMGTAKKVSSITAGNCPKLDSKIWTYAAKQKRMILKNNKEK